MWRLPAEDDAAIGINSTVTQQLPDIPDILLFIPIHNWIKLSHVSFFGSVHVHDVFYCSTPYDLVGLQNFIGNDDKADVCIVN